MKYKNVVLGGTFDHFHKGHKFFIDKACTASERVVIGLATPPLFKSKLLANLIEDYSVREENITNYLKDKGYFDRAAIIPIDDFYGNTLKEENIDALFSGEEGFPNVIKINEEREKIGFSRLEMVKVDYIYGDDNKIISSTRIRSGEIDREGNSFLKLFDKTLLLQEEDLKLRERIQVLGEVYKDIQNLKNNLAKKSFIITVGDMVSSAFLNDGPKPNISIIDLKTERKSVENVLGEPDFRVENPAGTINPGAARVIREAIEKSLQENSKNLIMVDGEEDLLALPAILLSPIGSSVLYGLRGAGVVEVECSEEKKKEIKDVVGDFSY